VWHDHTINHVNSLLDKELGEQPGSAAGTTHFFDHALLDHFTGSFSTPERKWSQRYYVDTTHWGGEGFPVFLYIGGEGPQSAPSERLFMWTLAEEHKALMLSLEHRYYGESQPTDDMSNANLAYLTSAQALADIGYFAEYINANSGGNDSSSSPPLSLSASTASSQWVAFGGSYPGNLATWLKLKYPALVAGTVGSSAPVLAEYDYIQYAEVVGSALAYDFIGGSDACRETVASATEALMGLVSGTTPWGLDPTIPTSLKPCSPMSSALDLGMYQSELFGNFQGMVQYNLMSYKPYVADVCASMAASVAAGDSALDAFATATALFYNPEDQNHCISETRTHANPRVTHAAKEHNQFAASFFPTPLSLPRAVLYRIYTPPLLSLPCPLQAPPSRLTTSRSSPTRPSRPWGAT